MPPQSIARRAILSVCAAALTAAPARADDKWIEMKSPHFTVTSNGGEGATRTLAWQLEQIRGALAVLWPWAKLDLNRPLVIIAVKDEASMKALVPTYWEQKNGVRPVTVWVGGVDQDYMAIRVDERSPDKIDTNPYSASYFSHLSLVLQQSLDHPLPLWLSRGLAGVLSNTLVRDEGILLGPPIPWHLRELQEPGRLAIPALLAVTRNSPEFRRDDGLRMFDAESWAFVHFLMFANNGVNWPKLDKYMNMVASGTAADAAFREVFGPAEAFEGPFRAYISRNLYSYRRANVDVTLKRESFPTRPLAPADVAVRRALLHTALNRPAEARAAIADARKAGDAPETLVAEALLLDREDKDDEAQQALIRAVDAKTTNPHAYYRLASLLWRGTADRDTLTRVEQLLSKAVALNTRYAAAYAMLGDARSALQIGEPMGMVLRAISLDPTEPHYRLTAATVLAREGKYDEALKHVETALALASDDQERQRALQARDRITRARGGGIH